MSEFIPVDFSSGAENLRQEFSRRFPGEGVYDFSNPEKSDRELVRTGKLTDAKVIRGVHEILDKEAMRVINAAPDKWLPGVRYGKPKKTTYTLPVIFE